MQLAQGFVYGIRSRFFLDILPLSYRHIYQVAEEMAADFLGILYRESKGKMAYAIIEVDTMVSSQVINALRGFEAVKNVLLVPAINLD